MYVLIDIYSRLLNAELLKGITKPKSHFGRAGDKLGVEVIPAADPADAHVPPGQADLGEIMCFEHGRTVANDYVVRFECRLKAAPRKERQSLRPLRRA
jgi:hypothetical protein